MITILISILTCSALPQDPTQTPPQPINVLQFPNQPQGLIPGEYGLFVFLNNPRVVEELRLTEKQKADWQALKEMQQERITASLKKIEAERKDIIAKMREAEKGTEAREKLADQLTVISDLGDAKRKEIYLLNDREVVKILDRKQEARLREIRFQAEGPYVFQRPDIRASLNLEPDQITAIGRIRFQYVKDLRTAGNLPVGTERPANLNPGTPGKEAFEKKVKGAHANMAGVRMEAMKSIEKVLSNTQRKIYKKMVGESFDFLGAKDKELAEAAKDAARPQNEKAEERPKN